MRPTLQSTKARWITLLFPLLVLTGFAWFYLAEISGAAASHPDHRTRIASKNGNECARIYFVERGQFPDWNIESEAGPANLATLDEAVHFARRACGGGDVTIEVER